MGLGKKLRFEVFKRDKFTCQYCGRSAPDIILHVDHIEPVSRGGKDDLLNLVTSCRDCNLGKGNRQLSDDTVLKQRKRQLDELQERREQLEMQLDWQRSLLEEDEFTITELADFWTDLVPGFLLNEHGLQNLRKWVTKYSVTEVIEAMKTATTQYLKYEDADRPTIPTKTSVEHAIDYIPRICSVMAASKEKPHLQRLFYIRGILRKRLSYVNERALIQFMERTLKSGVPVEAIESLAKEARNWTVFKETMESWQEGHYNGEG
jgi:hypothetical protein